MKVGIILECGPEGPDVKVCSHLLRMLASGFDFIIKTLNNKPNLLNECGKTAKNLIVVDKCSRVIVIWDLYPAWREKGVKPCRKEDKQTIIESMAGAGVSKSKYEMVCIEEELESWLIADERMLTDFLTDKKKPHTVGRLLRVKKPDKQRNPKTYLTKIFNRELGASRRYIDFQDAEALVRYVKDFSRLKKSDSFCRFVQKVTGESVKRSEFS